MPVSSRPARSDANDALLAPSARMQEQRTATTVVVARRPIRPAPSASSVNRVRSRLMMVNVNNAQSARSRHVLDRVHAIRADLQRSRMSIKPLALSAQPVHSPTTTACVRHANPVPSRELVPLSVKSAHAEPRPTVLIPSVCTATQVSSRRLIRNAKLALSTRSRHVSVHASVTIAHRALKPMLHRVDASCAMPVSSRPARSDANDALLAPSVPTLEQRTATTVVVARRPIRPAPSASSACRATSRLMMVNANNAQSARSRHVLDRVHAIRADLQRSRMSTKPLALSAQPVHSPTTTACVKTANPVPSRPPVLQLVKSVHAAPRPTAIVPSVCTATQVSSRRLIRNAKLALSTRSRHVSVHASVTIAHRALKPMLHRVDASCAMLVSSRPARSDANDALLAPSARMQEQRTATTVVVARRPTRPAPSASSACRATSRAMMVNANNAQSTRSPLVLVHVHAIRADLHHSRMSIKPLARCVLLVRTLPVMACANCVHPELFLRPEQQCVSTAHAEPRPTMLVPSVCSATLASSPTADRNAKRAP
jgi:hypothetical protein